MSTYFDKIISSNRDNPHVYISGQSGTGKSFLIQQHLVPQAVEQGALVLVPDYTTDFLRYTPPDDGLNFQRIDVTSPAFMLNPLIGLPGQSPDARAQQLLAALHSVFRMGPRATVSLRHATAAYLVKNGGPTLNGLRAHLSELENPGKGLEAAEEPLSLLASLIHCGEQPISLDLGTPGLIVLDFSKIYDQDLCKLLVELTLEAVWTMHTANQPPLILVLDEAQRLNWGVSSQSIRILREGRKFDIAGWFASQWVSNKDAVAALGQAALQAHFRPDDQHLRPLAKRLCPSGGPALVRHQQLIQSLQRGQFIYLDSSGKVLKVSVPRENLKN